MLVCQTFDTQIVEVREHKKQRMVSGVQAQGICGHGEGGLAEG